MPKTLPPPRNPPTPAVARLLDDLRTWLTSAPPDESTAAAQVVDAQHLQALADELLPLVFANAKDVMTYPAMHDLTGISPTTIQDRVRRGKRARRGRLGRTG